MKAIVVIDIPDEDYGSLNKIKFMEGYVNRIDGIEELTFYKYDLKTLPDGHGRLGDLDALEKSYLDQFWACMDKDENFDAIKVMQDIIKNAPAIIEADKESGKLNNMAEPVEVVIKIPKYYLTHPQDYICLAECVRRGVSLPKRHGRLIDADALLKDVRDNSVSYFADDFAHEWVDVAPTIIEADNKEE